jgi:transcriptional regulator with XRE-family HTH domain
MATTLAPVDSREVIRCDRCHLVQFQTHNHLCRRCHASLDPEEPVAVQVAQPAPAASPSNGNGHPQLQIAAAIRNLRQRSGLSQRQLALRMQVPRTYVSKIENEKAMPTLSSLERLARALQVHVPDLLNGGTRSQEDEIRELMADPFIAELVPYVSKLNAMQCSNILSQIRDMTTRIRKSS